MLDIHTIMSLVHGGSANRIPNRDEHVPISVIMNAAEWPHFEKTALWHNRLAECLLAYQYYDEAMGHFQIALDTDIEMWEARNGIATIYAARQEHDKGIDTWKINDSVLEGFLSRKHELKEGATNYCTNSDRANVHADIGYSYKYVGDLENRLRHIKTAIELEKSSSEFHFVLPCIYMLAHEMKDPSGIISLLKDLDEEAVGQKPRLPIVISDNSWWDEDFFIQVRAAAKSVHELPWTIEAYEAATAIARKERQSAWATVLDVCLAELYLEAGYKKEKAARVWDRIIKLPTNPGVMEDIRIKYCTRFSIVKYSVYCLDKARELEHGTPEEKKWIQRLEKLCKAKKKATDDAPQVITTSTSALRLGLWYREKGCLEKANACFQPFIREALMILSDDDPENDSEGLSNLACALAAAGDDDCALAALRALRPEKRQDKPSRGGLSDTGEEDSGSAGPESPLGEIKDDAGDMNGREIIQENNANGKIGEAGGAEHDTAVTYPETINTSVSYNELPYSKLISRLSARYPRSTYYVLLALVL
jgi:tetratricopeptide (TPR) repeat protein